MKAKFSEADIWGVFADRCEHVPPGSVDFVDKPDVVVTHDGHRHGFEITEIFHTDFKGRPAVVQHAQADEIVALARRQCTDEHLSHLYVSIAFAFNMHMPKSEWGAIAQQLAEIVQSHAPAPISRARWTNDYSGRWSFALEHVEIANFPELHQSMWRHEGAGVAQTDLARELQAKIDAKAKLLPTYLERCDECSLIVAAGGVPGVSGMFPSDECLNRIYLSPFSGTYFVRVREPICVRLSTTHTI